MTEVGFTVSDTLATEARDYAAPDAWASFVKRYNQRKRTVVVYVDEENLDSFVLSLASAADMAQIASERRRWLGQVGDIATTLEDHGFDLSRTKRFLRI